MPDVFLSYNREDQAIARRFAETLEREGLEVWWDATLRAGEAYDKVTEQALSEAKAVIVLWSPHSVDSRWVRAEATQADRNGTLVPAMIEPCKRPIMFELTQTADLSHWRGDPGDKAWVAFLSDVRRRIARDAPELIRQEATSAPARRFLARRPILAAGLTAFALLVVAIAGFALTRQPEGASATFTEQRTAFFGFSEDGSDPTATAIARSATSETYQTLGALGLETASASQTQSVERSLQLARANELRARYALGGEVRRDGDQFKVTIWLEDAQTHTTLLGDDTVTGGEAEKLSLSVRAAAHATNALHCYIGARTGLRRLLRSETDEMTRVMARICQNGPFLEAVEGLRDLARLATDSPGIQAFLALNLFLAINQAPAKNLPVMRREIDAALSAAQDGDPSNGFVRVIQAELSIADGKSLSEAEKFFLTAREADRDLFFLNIRYGMFLRSVGRFREAVPYLEASVRQRPLAAGTWTTLASTLAAVGGRTNEAEQKYRSTANRFLDAGNWNAWISSALFDGAGDPREVLNAPPPSVSPDAVACVGEIVRGLQSRNTKQRASAADRVISCATSNSLAPRYAIQPAAALGNLGGAFLLASQSIDRKAYAFDNAATLFSTGARPMRADPRFLPLVKELGIFQFWIDTGTPPDVCETPEERQFEVCRELHKELGK